MPKIKTKMFVKNKNSTKHRQLRERSANWMLYGRSVNDKNVNLFDGVMTTYCQDPCLHAEKSLNQNADNSAKSKYYPSKTVPK